MDADRLALRIISKPNGSMRVLIGETDITDYISDLKMSITSDTYGRQSTVVHLDLTDMQILSMSSESPSDTVADIVQLNRAGKRRFSL